MKFLRGRWLYIGLAALTLSLYARLFLAHHRAIVESGSVIAAAEREDAATSAARLKAMDLGVKDVLKAARRRPDLALWLMLFVAVGALIAVGGIVMSVRAMWTGRIRNLFSYPSRLPYVWPLGDALRLIALLALLAMLLPFVRFGLMLFDVTRFNDVHAWSLASMFVLYGLLLLLVWGFASLRGQRVRTVLGLITAHARAAIGEGLAGYVATFPWIFGLIGAIGAICQRFGINPGVEPIHELIFFEQRGLIVAWTVLLACVLGPIAEEIFFRGILYSALRQRCSRRTAMLISSALFSLVHTNLIGFIPIVVLGWLLADRYERTGSLLSPIAIHILHNSFLMAVALLLKQLVAVAT